jgi:hypothetical protein
LASRQICCKAAGLFKAVLDDSQAVAQRLSQFHKTIRGYTIYKTLLYNEYQGKLNCLIAPAG